MNKREFVAGGMAAVVAAPSLAQVADGDAGQATLRELLMRTQRRPDLLERAGADAFEAYIGEPFSVVGGPGAGERLVLTCVERVARSLDTEQFNVAFSPATADATPAAGDGLRILVHGTGQRLRLHLERDDAGYTARFNLLI